MKGLIFITVMRSLKTEIAIVFGVIALLCLLPVLTVVALAGSSPISTTGTIYNGPLDTKDTYDFGNCTYWVSLLRAKIKDPIPNTWGNAATWASRAQLDGYVVNHIPSYSAIMQTANVDHGLGHVAFVESVDPKTGSWTISEMNVLGWDVVDTRTLSAISAQSFYFIHQRVGTLPPAL